MSDKLKLCPFCGSDDISSGEAMLEHEHEPNVIYKQTGCLSCGAFGSETKEDDIYGTKCDDAWNKRAESEHKIKVLRDSLQNLFVLLPDLACQELHHPKKMRHGHGEKCPVVDAYNNALANAKKALKDTE